MRAHHLLRLAPVENPAERSRILSARRNPAWLRRHGGWPGVLRQPPQFLARFQTAGQDATSLSRIFYWSKAKEMMRTHPWFGVGYYNWIPYYKDHYFDPTLYWRVEEAHNTVLADGGGARLHRPGPVHYS